MKRYQRKHILQTCWQSAIFVNALYWISPIGVKISTGVRKHRKKRVEGDHERGGDGGDGCEKEGNDGGGCDSDAEEKKRWGKRESRGGGEEEEEWLTGWPQHKPEVNQTYRSYRSLPLPPTELLPVTSLYLDFALRLSFPFFPSLFLSSLFLFSSLFYPMHRVY